MTEAAITGGYRILSVLGRGGFGTVYRARYEGAEGFSKEVAIKVLNPDLGGAEEMARRLRDEARMLGLLRHPAIVTVDRLARLEGRWAVVMELIDGVDLQQLADAEELPLGVVMELGAHVAGALHEAWHTPGPTGRPLKVLHRDIKPGNVLLTAYGEVKVLDFGVARAEIDSREAHTGRFIMGSPQYMAPERLEGEEGPAGDVYSLGVMLLQALTGDTLGRTTPVTKEHTKRLAAKLQPLRVALDGDLALVADLLAVLLDHDPDQRPSARDCQEALSALAEHAGGPGLRRWAVETVPPLLARLRIEAATAAKEAGIDGTFLPDDSGAAAVAAGQEVEATSPPVHAGPEPQPAPDDVAVSEEEAETEREADTATDAETVADEDPFAGVLEATQPRSSSAPRLGSASRSAASAAARRDDFFHQVAPPPEEQVPWRIIGLAISLGAAIGVVGMLWMGGEPPQQAAVPEVQPMVAPGADIDQPGVIPAPVSTPAATTQPDSPPAGPAEQTPSLQPQAMPPKVMVSGDADEVYLVSQSRAYRVPGPVPADTYTVEAVFPGRGRQVAGTVQVQIDQPMTVHCSAAQLACKAR